MSPIQRRLWIKLRPLTRNHTRTIASTPGTTTASHRRKVVWILGKMLRRIHRIHTCPATQHCRPRKHAAKAHRLGKGESSQRIKLAPLTEKQHRRHDPITHRQTIQLAGRRFQLSGIHARIKIHQRLQTRQLARLAKRAFHAIRPGSPNVAIASLGLTRQLNTRTLGTRLVLIRRTGRLSDQKPSSTSHEKCRQTNQNTLFHNVC